MKNTVALFFSILFVFSSILAQEAAPSNRTSDKLLPTEKALLWEISKNELEEPSYLFGTIHMINKEDFFLSDLTKENFKKSERVTFEINLEEMMDFTALMPLMMKAFMSDGITLKDILKEEDYQLIEEHFNEKGIPLMFLERIKPMFLSVLISDDFSQEGLTGGDIVSYEMELLEIARDQEKEIGGLETAEYQMSMFDSIPYKAQAEMLVESIKTGDTGDDQFKEMVDLYKNQDIQGMQDMVAADAEGIGKYEELLLVNRNKNWIPIMAEMMEEKPTFFAVGAGHLGGEKGVIALLRAEGYKVVPLK